MSKITQSIDSNRYEDDGQVHDFEADDFPAEEVLGKRKRNVVSYIEYQIIFIFEILTRIIEM